MVLTTLVLYWKVYLYWCFKFLILNNNNSKHLLFLLALFFAFNIKAQKKEFNDDINDFLKNDTNNIYIKNNGYYFIEIPKEKSYKSRIVGEVIINDTNEFNIFDLNVVITQNDFQYYLVKNQNLLLVIKSIDFIKKEIENEY